MFLDWRHLEIYDEPNCCADETLNGACQFTPDVTLLVELPE